MNAFVIRPLDVPHADSLYALQHGNEARGTSRMRIMWICAIAIAPSSRCLRITRLSLGLDDGRDPSSVWVLEASGNYFDTLV